MATLLFRLGNVPEQEAAEVRRLLEARGFATFESRAGFWGLGVAAIWLRDETDYAAARETLDAYQQGLAERMRQEHDALAERGAAPTLWSRLRQHPVRVLLVAMAVAVILTLTLLPFLGLID
ncbi:DUF6164 family protein [Halomonas sp. SSL-5]|uniref:DUF6164 family protein n=1 Tax=Halomonas sp. SSL-5 TaxID=3065855 RepID=UPI00273A3F19|nr:DUF6164 family protein [Halomonas sp. SSL-5]MDY7116203.1 DUF6164 family protein [Halomonas sp. SSL-5]